MTDSPEFPSWPPNWPEIAAAVDAAVRNGDWGRYHGDSTARLTAKIAEMCGVSHCRLLCSGSLGVELALRVLGISPTDRVALCAYDYPGNFRAIELVGARPVLLDADSHSFSLAPENLDALSLHSDAQINAVIVSHLYGVPARIAEIRAICDSKGWKLIEDACQTPGMEIDGQPAGSWGDASVLSFGGSKPLTSGTGGALLTNDDLVASKWTSYLDRPSDATPLGELAAASLLPQLSRLAECNRVRWESTAEILQQVDWIDHAVGGRRPSQASTAYKLAFSVPDRDALIERMKSQGLPVGHGYRSMHRSSDRRCDKMGTLDKSQKLGSSLCLLDHAALLATGRQRDRLIEILLSCRPS